MKNINLKQVLNLTIGEIQMHGKTQKLLMMLILATVSATVWAKPEITLSVISEKEIIEINQGKKNVKRVPANEIEPGQVLIFTLKYSNKGDEAATNVVFDNPVPKETVYEMESAEGSGSDITFSINRGKEYKKPTYLTYEIKGADGKTIRKKASPDQYTNVRWVIPNIPPGSSGELSFRARVK